MRHEAITCNLKSILAQFNHANIQLKVYILKWCCHVLHHVCILFHQGTVIRKFKPGEWTMKTYDCEIAYAWMCTVQTLLWLWLVRVIHRQQTTTKNFALQEKNAFNLWHKFCTDKQLCILLLLLLLSCQFITHNIV